MSLWSCIQCGCRAIARDLGFCPQCFKVREDDVPKVNTDRASNKDARPGEIGYLVPPDTASEAVAADLQTEAPAKLEETAAGDSATHGDAGIASDSVRVVRSSSRRSSGD